MGNGTWMARQMAERDEATYAHIGMVQTSEYILYYQVKVNPKKVASLSPKNPLPRVGPLHPPKQGPKRRYSHDVQHFCIKWLI